MLEFCGGGHLWGNEEKTVYSTTVILGKRATCRAAWAAKLKKKGAGYASNAASKVLVKVN